MAKTKYEVTFVLTDNPAADQKPAKKKDLLAAAKSIALPVGVTAGKFSISPVV